MGVMSLRGLHADLKLGIVLVSAAALLKIVGWGSFAAERFARYGVPAGRPYVVAGTIGGLAVVAAAIWVDRRPPHTMMAADAVVAVLGLTIVFLSNLLAVAVFGMFVAGVGSSAVGSLVFYAIAGRGPRGKGAR